MRFVRLLALIALVPFLAAAAVPDLLEPEQAFRLSARASQADTIEVRYQIAPGYYLYRDKFRFSVEPENVKTGAAELPPGKRKKDEFFGEVETYRGDLRFRVPLNNARAGENITLTATSQGCADVGVCYIPQDQKLSLVVGGAEASFSAPAPTGLPAGFFSSDRSAGGEDRAIARLFQGNFAILIASFFGFGLVLSLTPCMLPMIPILSGIIAGRGARLTRFHGFMLALAYVLGMAITYAIAGVLAGLSGAMLSAALQSPWVIVTFALLFVMLAGAMFGLYELQLPPALQTRLASATNRLHGGHFAGVFAMGALSALIMGPCVAAPLAGALLYISQSRDGVLGGTALFSLALGMGVPLLVVGASAGALLPKAGPWMETAKRFFGVVLLGVAIYLVSPLVPVFAQMLAWAVLLVIVAIELHAFERLREGAPRFDRYAKGAGILALVAAIAYVVGAFSGSRDVLRPLEGLVRGTGAPSTPVAFDNVGDTLELDRAVRAASGRPVMLDFYADWCVACKEMERDTFSDPGVRKRLDTMVKLRADVTANSADHKALLQRFHLFGPPGIIFFDRAGREIPHLRVIGFQPPARFAAVLDQALTAPP